MIEVRNISPILSIFIFGAILAEDMHLGFKHLQKKKICKTK